MFHIILTLSRYTDLVSERNLCANNEGPAEWLVDGFYVERLRENPLPAYAGPFPLSGGHKKRECEKMLFHTLSLVTSEVVN